MARTRKSKTAKRDLYPSFADSADEADEDADLPKDEAGRRRSSVSTRNCWASGSRSSGAVF
jgi:hypothetical protein